MSSANMTFLVLNLVCMVLVFSVSPLFLIPQLLILAAHITLMVAMFKHDR